MTDIFSIIRRDGEFVHSVSAIEEQLRANNPLPIAINGLQGGAVSAYLVESVREVRRLSGMPVLILVRDDAMAVNTVERLSDGGLRALRFKSREPVFHNISASADVDRERLSVLISVLRGECDTVVSTLSAALSYTMPRALLLESSITLKIGEEIPFSELERI